MQWPDLLRIQKECDAFTHTLDVLTQQSIIDDSHPMQTTTQTWQASVEH